MVINSYLGEIDFAILTYEKGTKKCTLDIKPQGKHPSLINTIPLCDDLLKPEYKAITQFIDSIIFDIPASKTLDPTLGWLLDVYSSKKTIENHKFPFCMSQPCRSRLAIRNARDRPNAIEIQTVQI